MQHHEISRRHQERGGTAVQSGPSSLIDRLLHPMLSLGFYSNDESDNILGLKSSSIQEEEEKINGENPNSSGKKRATKLCSRGHWKPSEDAKLRELVATYGPQNWNLIAENLQGRSGKSCRLRWYNQLDPKINKRAFTAEEEERLTEAHRIYGSKWSFISRLFPGRTDNSVKNHWHVLMARRSREKSKSYMKMKWSTSNSPSLETNLSVQETADQYNSLSNVNYYGEHLFQSNYEHLNHGNSYTPLSTSQVSFSAPVSSSTSVGDQYRDAAAYYGETAEAPAFIDFLGVGFR